MGILGPQQDISVIQQAAKVNFMGDFCFMVWEKYVTVLAAMIDVCKYSTVNYGDAHLFAQTILTEFIKEVS